jgi:TetR/AcrR family transcriptional regulator, transcriptional repressor for nem operon
VKTDTKQRILFEGARLVHLKGFGSTGIQEILKAAGVPKGSFYFYFKSKEDFGLELIDFFREYIYGKWDVLDQMQELSPLQRLQGFFRWFLSLNERNGYKGGCPLGNLGQEMGDINERFQEKLRIVFAEFKSKIRSILVEAKEAGEIPESLPPEELSDLIYSTFHGALIQMKVSGSPDSMENFNHLFFKLVAGYGNQDNQTTGRV